MTKLISVKIDETDLRKAEASARTTGLSRNAYINKAVRLFNRLAERRKLALQLHREARLVGQESSAVLREFESIQDEGL